MSDQEQSDSKASSNTLKSRENDDKFIKGEDQVSNYEGVDSTDDNLIQKLSEYQDIIEVKSKEIEILDESIAKLKMNKEDVRESLKDLNSKIDEKRSKLENLDLEIQAEKNREFEKLQNKISELSEKLRFKINQVETLEEALQEKDAKIKNLEKKDNDKLNQIEDLIQDKEELEKRIRNLEENNLRHLDTISNLKIELKELRDLLESEGDAQDQFQEEIIELKKEIKVLRRERDHYRKLVKENELV